MAQDPHLQQFGYRESSYERPTQRWLCGHLPEGRPCRVGPDRRGRCIADFECIPVRKGDRWQCTRPPHAGGRCDEGPGSAGKCAHPIVRCQPIRNHRSARGVVARWMAAITLGLLMVGGAGSAGLDFFRPGALTFHHGDIADCGRCHSAPMEDPAALIAADFLPDTTLTDAELCMDCHRYGEHALRPHSIPPEELTDATLRAMATISPETGDVVSPPPRPPLLKAARWIEDFSRAPWELGCATCHQEHQGQHAELTAMDDLRCQGCHLQQFASLAAGHPPFLSYPYERRTRIIFDHAAHIGKHFEEDQAEDAPEACTECHELGPGGGDMLVKGFERGCAACHAEEIMGAGRAGAKGLPVLSVPGLDAPVLAEAGLELGTWPRAADAEPTPIMRLLLRADPEVGAALDRLEGTDLLDLRESDEAVLAAAATLGWGVKKLILEMAARGHAALRERLEAALGHSVDDHRMGLLAGLLPADAVVEAQREWFPDLAQEIARHEAGLPLAPPRADDEEEVATEAVEESASNGAAETDLLDDGALLGGGGLLDREPGGDSGEDAAGDLLGGSLLADESPSAEQSMPDDGALLEGGLLEDEAAEDDSLLGGDLLTDDEEETGQTDDPPAADPEIPALDAEAWTSAGGWYRQFLTLYYRPTGHADRFLKGWLELTAGPASGPAATAAKDVFEALAAPKAPGLCTKCHSVDAGFREDGTPTGVLNVNWQTEVAPVGNRRFTKYAHLPHFSLLDEKGCLTCHTLEYEAPYAASFDDRKASTFTSNFAPMGKEICAACHREEQAGSRCVDCHNYHVGDFPPALAAAPLVLRGNRAEPDGAAAE